MARYTAFVTTLLLLSWTPVIIAAEIDSVAGTGQPANTGAAGPARQTGIGEPFGVEVGPDGALYITEVKHHRVRRLDLQTGELTTVAGNGRKGYSGDGGPATKAELNEPYEVRFDAMGNMYFVEMQNHLVRRVDAQTQIISTVAGTGQPGFSGDGGSARQAQFRQPHSITLDDHGGLYVADIGNHRIRRIDLQTQQIESIAGNGQKQLPKDQQPVRDQPVAGPRALFYRDHILWVALREGHSVWKLDLRHDRWAHIAGTGMPGYSGDEGPAAAATFNGPKGIALDAEGNIFIADTENQVIRRIDAASGKMTTVAGSGPQSRGSGGDQGPPLQAQMDRPHGVCVDAQGVIYVGDTLNHLVHRIRP